MNPTDSYRSDHLYAPSEYGNGKKANEHNISGEGYASPPSAPRDYSDQGSVKGYGSGIKGYGSNLRSHCSTTPSTQDHSLKDVINDFNRNDGCDHRGDEHVNTRFSSSRNGSGHSNEKEFGNDRGSGRNIVDTRGSSDCGYGGHYSCDHVSNETHQDSNYVSNIKDYIRPGMSWLDRHSFLRGEPCALPVDWDHNPILRQVPPDEHQNYRHARLEEWLSTAHKRRLNENFGAYVWRASALANSELRHRKKQCWGDEYGDPVDKFVMRLFYGMKLKLERTESIVLGVDDETGILDILREECEGLNKSGQLPIDQRSIQYTPLIISEMQERSCNGGY